MAMLTTGNRIDPRRPDVLLSEAAERELITKRLARLPKREALFADRVNGRTHLIRTMTVEIDKAERSLERLSDEELLRFERGRLGIPAAELIAQTRALQERTFARHTAPSSSEEPALKRRRSRRKKTFITPE